jgi:cytochrome b
VFALSFAGAYLTGDSEHWRALHVALGYTMAGALGFRVVYGLIGPRHARLGALLRRLLALPGWVRATAAALMRGQLASAPWRQGQNLATAVAVVGLLALSLPLLLSGLTVEFGWLETLGGGWLEEAFEELHEATGEAMLALVFTHIGLILGFSLLRRRNLASPMWSGRVPGRGPDLVKHNRAGLAAVMLAVAVGALALLWQAAPNGLLPRGTLDGGSSWFSSGDEAGGAARADGGRRHDDDDDDD